MCCCGADDMDPRHNELASAGFCGRALHMTANETGSFGATLLHLAGVAIPSHTIAETRPCIISGNGAILIDQHHADVPRMKTGFTDYCEHALVDAFTLRKFSHDEKRKP